MLAQRLRLELCAPPAENFWPVMTVDGVIPSSGIWVASRVGKMNACGPGKGQGCQAAPSSPGRRRWGLRFV